MYANRVIQCAVVLVTLIVLSVPMPLPGACKMGCCEGHCWKEDDQCWQTTATTAWWASDDTYGNTACGAVGGTRTGASATVTWSKVPICTKECPNNISRALNTQGQSTCSGSQTDPVDKVKYYCAS
jgi:hypothetical protein